MLGTEIYIHILFSSWCSRLLMVGRWLSVQPHNFSITYHAIWLGIFLQTEDMRDVTFRSPNWFLFLFLNDTNIMQRILIGRSIRSVIRIHIILLMGIYGLFFNDLLICLREKVHGLSFFATWVCIIEDLRRKFYDPISHFLIDQSIIFSISVQIIPSIWKQVNSKLQKRVNSTCTTG